MPTNVVATPPVVCYQRTSMGLILRSKIVLYISNGMGVVGVPFVPLLLSILDCFPNLFTKICFCLTARFVGYIRGYTKPHALIPLLPYFQKI